MFKKKLCKVYLCIGVFATLSMLTQAAPQRLDVSIDIYPQKSLGKISPYIFGAGVDAKTNPLRFPKYPQKVLRNIEESGIRMIRFPGGFVFNRNVHRGSWANFYWKDHIGKNPSKRPTEVYDIDTFLQLCERFNIEPLMQINFVGEPVESIRGYIEYITGTGDIDKDGIDWAAVRKKNGREKPYKVKYWELGNEVHSYPQGFKENRKGAKEYAVQLNKLVPMIRKLVPNSKILVPFINIERPISGMMTVPPKADINFSSSSQFTQAFLKHLRVKIDYFDWHFYAANGWHNKWQFLGTDNEWKQYYCWGTKFRECYEVIVKLMKTHCKQRPQPQIIVGEWSGDWTGGIYLKNKDSFRGSMMRTMATGIYMADILMFMMKKSASRKYALKAAFWHAFTNDAQALFSIQTTKSQGVSYKGISTDAGYGIRMPIYWVFKLLSEQRGKTLVASLLKGKNNTIHAPKNGIYTDPEYTFERVSHCVSRSDNKLYIALLNKDAKKSVNVCINIRAWRYNPQIISYEVSGKSYLDENTIKQPDCVKLSKPKIIKIKLSEPVRYFLKPNTLAVLKFTKDAFGKLTP